MIPTMTPIPAADSTHGLSESEGGSDVEEVEEVVGPVGVVPKIKHWFSLSFTYVH